MTETFVVSKSLGDAGLAYKITAIEDEGYQVKSVTLGEIPQAGSLSTPYARNYGKTEPGWVIRAERVERKLVSRP